MFPRCPEPPDGAIDWSRLDPLPWLQAMRGCPQNPDRHAEGDVWNHVHLVVEAMTALPAWRALPEGDRQILFASALLHDVAKPACTRIEPDGRVSARGHSWRGAVKARGILWKRGFPFADRETVCAVVRHHLVPFFLADSEDPRRLAIEVSQTVRCDLLALMAEADVRGRVCPDPNKLLDQIERFKATAAEAGCLDTPYPFASDDERFAFFRHPAKPSQAVEPRPEVVMLSGLPSAGKDHWLERNPIDWPVVSLDAIRDELGVPPADPQGAVLTCARDRAKDHLRQGTSFVWNGTNLSRNVRHDCLRLFHAFDARVRLVYVEAPPDRLYAQNRQRARKVPERVIDRMLERWEVPDVTEAHAVQYVLDA